MNFVVSVAGISYTPTECYLSAHLCIFLLFMESGSKSKPLLFEKVLCIINSKFQNRVRVTSLPCNPPTRSVNYDGTRHSAFFPDWLLSQSLFLFGGKKKRYLGETVAGRAEAC